MRWLIFTVGVLSLLSLQADEVDADRFVQYLEHHKGDAAAGAKLFADAGATACASCHTVDGSGGKPGPDLASIGDKYDSKGLIRSIILPSETLLPGYSTTIVRLSSGEEHSGILVESSPRVLKLAEAGGNVTVLKREQVAEQTSSELSLMPEGLAAGLSGQQFSDLIAYLAGLRTPALESLKRVGAPSEIKPAKQLIRIERYNKAEHDFDKPVWISAHPVKTNTMVVLEHRKARAWLLERHPDGTETKDLFADFSDEVSDGPWEGLMSVAFHPLFAENRRYFLKHETKENGKRFTIVVEKRAHPDGLRDSGTFTRRLVRIEQPADNHNGGTVLFGGDGYLYFAMGDGGPQEDPLGRSQNWKSWMGKVHRIDVDREDDRLPYGIPEDNPFYAVTVPGVRREIWAIGFREPWRIAFDAVTGDLWVGDVGQGRFEEVTVVRKGENHGWNVYEGFEIFSGKYRRPETVYVPPLIAFQRRHGVSVTGGFVYRGLRDSSYYGVYICGDFETRRVWGMRSNRRQLEQVLEIGLAPAKIASFGEGSDGEIYLVGYDGVIYSLNLGEARFE